jgi:hypothetical protein
VDSAQGCDLVAIFGDLSQSEKLSEINPSLKMLLRRLRKKQRTKNRTAVPKRLPK